MAPHGMSQRIIDLVAKRPNVLDASQLAHYVYEDLADGGPDGAENVVKTTIKRMNVKIAPTGWVLTAGRGRQGYRFVRVDQ